MPNISSIYAREVLDSRGNPTIEVEVLTEVELATEVLVSTEVLGVDQLAVLQERANIYDS